MKIVTTTGDFCKYKLSLKETISRIHAAGFRYLDMSFYGESEYMPFLKDDWKEYTAEILHFAENLGMKFVQAHSPCGDALDRDESYEPFVKATIRSIEVCELLGIPNIVVHAGAKQGITKEEFFKGNLEYYQRLFPAMEEHHVNVLIENSTKANCRGDTYYFFTGKDMMEFIRYANHPLLHACWDTGHANIEGHQYEDILALGSELYAIHFNDNQGTIDRHIIAFDGTMNIAEVMHGLIDSGYHGYFTFESGYVFSGKNRIWNGDDRLAQIPLEVRQAKEHMMYIVGKEILKAYDLLEE